MIRHAAESDLPRILEIYDVARQFMRQSGNMVQWVNGYPGEPLLRQDITNGDLYVMADDAGVYAVFALVIGDDPTYTEIDGAWRDTATPYGTIHRIGSDGTHRGVLHECVDWCAGRISHLRVDTHADNLVMRRAIAREGFAYCGVIHVADGTPRVAFERIPSLRGTEYA